MSSWSGQRLDVSKQIFKAYMKLESGKKIHVDTDENPEKLRHRIESYISILGDLVSNSSI